MRPAAPVRAPHPRSCLHEWRVQKARQLRDPARCEVCGEPYRVPASVWRAYAAARGGGAGWQLTLVAAWQRLRPALAAAAALAWRGVRLYLQARHLCLWLGHAGYALVDQEQLPPLVAAAAGPCTDRLREYLGHMLRWSTLGMALERAEVRPLPAVLRCCHVWGALHLRPRLPPGLLRSVACCSPK